MIEFFHGIDKVTHESWVSIPPIIPDLVIDLPAEIGMWHDVYIEWEGDYLLIQLNWNEPQVYYTKRLGYFSSSLWYPDIFIFYNTDVPQILLTNQAFQLRLVSAKLVTVLC